MDITLKIGVFDLSFVKAKMCLRGTLSLFTFLSVAAVQLFLNLSLQSPKLNLDLQTWGQKYL